MKHSQERYTLAREYKIGEGHRYKRAHISRLGPCHVTVICRDLNGAAHGRHFKSVVGAMRWVTRNETKLMWQPFDAA